MKRLTCLVNALLFGVTLTAATFMPTVANAVDETKMYSPSLYVNDGTLTTCTLVNGGDEPVRVFVDIRNAYGVSFADFADAECEVGNELQVLPGEVCGILYRNATGGMSALHCKVTVFEKNHGVQASFQIRGTVGATYETSVAVDVRGPQCPLAPACPDADGDAWADCVTEPTCHPYGHPCGDCDDADPRVNPGAPRGHRCLPDEEPTPIPQG